MPYLVIESAPQYPCDALITYLTVELGAVLTTGPFGDAPNSQGLHDLLQHNPAFETYKSALFLSARLERQLRLKRIWDSSQQWLVGTDGLISAMAAIPGSEAAWSVPEREKGLRDEMQFVLQANTSILSDFDCMIVPDLTVCVRPDDPEQLSRLETAIDVWKEMFPDSPVMLVNPEVNYRDILKQLGQ